MSGAGMKGLEFYSAAVQIIPVLLLVVGFQIRAYALQGWWRWLALIEFILVVSAEIHALTVLQDETTNWADPWLTYTAISVLLTNIGAALFPWWYGFDPSRQPEATPKTRPPKTRARRHRR
jgi:hypothetical protein